MLHGGCQLEETTGAPGNGRLIFTMDGGSTNQRLQTFGYTDSSEDNYLQGNRYVTGSGSTTFQLRAEGSGLTLAVQTAAIVPVFMYLIDLGNASV
jgi:hypothetical protein